MRFASTALLASVLALSPLSALAHPDIAVTVRVLFDVQGGHLAAVGESWTFDTAYSARLMHGFDTDRDGVLSNAEANRLATATLVDLSDRNYLSRLRGGMTDIDLPSPSWMHATVTDGAVTLSFVVTLERPLGLKGDRAVALQIRDPDYFAAFRLATDRAVMIRGGEGRCKTEVEEFAEDSYFGGLVTPWEIALDCE